MGCLIESGVSVVEALRLLARRTRGRLSSSIDRVRESLDRGATFSEALAVDPALFPDHVRHLVSAGEQSGGLPAVFSGLAEIFEQRLLHRRRILRGCIYPFILFSLSFFLLPVSKLLSQGWGAYLRASLVPYLGTLLAIAAMVLAVPWFLRRVLGASLTDRIARCLPLLGKLKRVRMTFWFSRHLATSLGAGLDLHASLRLAARASGDGTLATRVEQASFEIQKGASLEEALERTKLFNDEFMLAVAGGEASGRLVEALEQQSRLARDSYTHRLKVMLQLTAVAILILVYAYVTWRTIGEYQNIFGGSTGQLDQLMKEMGGTPGSGGAIPKELQELLR